MTEPKTHEEQRLAALEALDRYAVMKEFCAGIDTEDMRGESLVSFTFKMLKKQCGDDYMDKVVKSLMANSEAAGQLDIDCFATGLFAQLFVHEFKRGGAKNYFEKTFEDPEVGEFTITMQRKEGETPCGQLEAARREINRLTSVVQANLGHPRRR